MNYFVNNLHNSVIALFIEWTDDILIIEGSVGDLSLVNTTVIVTG